jgi:hypothetical protein
MKSSLSSGILCHAVHRKSAYVSEEHIASIFKVEETAKQENSMKQAASKASHCFLGWFTLQP